jgi:hypothetical protein
MRIVIPQVIGAVETLCYNDAVTPMLLARGFAVALLAVASDISTGDGLIALSMRRSALQALVALSQSPEAKLEIKRRGGLQLASDVLHSATDSDLRRSGAVLACNLCLHGDNKQDVVDSGLFTQIVRAVRPPRVGEDTHLALALAALCNDASLLPALASAELTASLHALLKSGSKEARSHAAWATSTLATHRPVEPSLLAPALINTLARTAARPSHRLPGTHRPKPRSTALDVLRFASAALPRARRSRSRRSKTARRAKMRCAPSAGSGWTRTRPSRAAPSAVADCSAS